MVTWVWLLALLSLAGSQVVSGDREGAKQEECYVSEECAECAVVEMVRPFRFRFVGGC